MRTLAGLLAAPTTVYRFLDKDGEVLYIGIAVDFDKRRLQHARDKSWWSEVEDWKLVHYPCRLDAALAEREAIISELPRYNRLHHPDYHNTSGVHGYLPADPWQWVLKQPDCQALIEHIKALGVGPEEARDIIYDALMELDMIATPLLTTREELAEAKAAQARRVARGVSAEVPTGGDPNKRRSERSA